MSNRKRIKRQVSKVFSFTSDSGNRADLRNIEIKGDVGPQVHTKNIDVTIRGYSAEQVPGGVRGTIRYMSFGSKRPGE
jgi:hypothetical protein